MAGKIFINYRRSLNFVEAQLLQKVLQRHLHGCRLLKRAVDAEAALDRAEKARSSGNAGNQNDYLGFRVARTLD